MWSLHLGILNALVMKMLKILNTTLVTIVTVVITVTEFTKWYLCAAYYRLQNERIYA